MPARNVSRSKQPQGRLERLCEAMAEALEAHPEYREEDRAILMLNGPGEDGKRHGGLVMQGYGEGEDKDAAVDLLMQTEALFKANGLDFTFVPFDKPPQRSQMQ